MSWTIFSVFSRAGMTMLKHSLQHCPSATGAALFCALSSTARLHRQLALAGSCRGEIMVDKIGQSWEAVNRQLASQGLAGDARQKSVQPPLQATNRSPIFDMEPISRRVLVNMSRIMLTLSGTPSANVQVAVQSSVDVGAYVPASSIVGRHVRPTIELAGLSRYVGQGERASFSSDGPAGR